MNPTLADLTAKHMLRTVPPKLAAFCDVLMGDEDAELFNVDGLPLADDIVLVREAGDPRYLLAMKLAGVWYIAFTVAAYDPFISTWRDSLVAKGKSPAQLEADRNRESLGSFDDMTTDQQRRAIEGMGMTYVPAGSAPRPKKVNGRKAPL